jgi:hypothetical protein
MVARLARRWRQAAGSMRRTAPGGSTLAPPSPETIVLNKIDDKTILVQKTKNGNSTDPLQKLSYCSEDVQKMRAQQKAAK